MPCPFATSTNIPVAPSFIDVPLTNNDVIGIAGNSVYINYNNAAQEIPQGVYSWTNGTGSYQMYSLSGAVTLWICAATPTATGTLAPTITMTAQPTEIMPPTLPGGVPISSCNNSVDLYAPYGGSNDVMAMYARRCDLGCPINIDVQSSVHAKLCINYNYIYGIKIATIPIPLSVLFIGLMVLVIVYLIRRR
jgi:hypothetical protein